MKHSKSPVLKRELGLSGAVMMGLGSIIGTGVFVSIGIAAGIAGPSVALAIGIAGFVAMCNAFSSAQLAASHPVSGGTYEYGYRYLHPAVGFTAGWMFLCAKSASAATAALGFAGYLLHWTGSDVRLLVLWALVACVVVTVVILSGLRRTNLINFTIVSLTLLSLLCFVVFGLSLASENGSENFTPFWTSNPDQPPSHSFLYATALMFVAYTGYGRIATLGEEVRDPRRTIPKAIVLTLAISLVLYLAVAVLSIAAVGAETLSDASEGRAAPLEIVARRFEAKWVSGLVAIGAMTAMLGVLLNLILGLSRVLFAMGRRGDMPHSTAKVSNRSSTPYIAVIMIGVTVSCLAATGSVKTTWSFSAFTVLVYYAITNLAALRLAEEDRIYPRIFSWIGLFACVFLACWVPWEIWSIGLGLIGLGLVWQKWVRRIW